MNKSKYNLKVGGSKNINDSSYLSMDTDFCGFNVSPKIIF
jgi:hypothetical protein